VKRKYLYRFYDIYSGQQGGGDAAPEYQKFPLFGQGSPHTTNPLTDFYFFYENVFVFFCHAPSPERRAFEGCIVRTSIALTVYTQISTRFFSVFHKGLLFLFSKNIFFVSSVELKRVSSCEFEGVG